MKQRGQHGFTLIEVIIVLVILGLVMGLVMTRGPLHSARLDVQAAARDLAGSMRLARGRAIAEDRSVAVLVNRSGFQVAGLAPHRVPSDVHFTGSAAIRFAPDGSSTGGRVAVNGPSGGMQLAVDWLTGRVRLSALR